MTTKHNCNGDRPPIFGRRTVGCARCDELAAGAPPIKRSGTLRAEQDARTIAAIRAHDCRASRCGPVCTAFDW